MKKRRVLYTSIAFICGFVIAMAAAKAYFENKTASNAPAARTLAASDIAPILAAADAAKYEELERLGEELFVPGTKIPDSAALFGDYAVASFAPHHVYALMTQLGGEASRRVLLTMNEDDTVESFMAEETPIAANE